VLIALRIFLQVLKKVIDIPKKERKLILILMEKDPRPSFGWRVKDIEGKLKLKKAKEDLKYLARHGKIKRIKFGCYTMISDDRSQPTNEINDGDHNDGMLGRDS